MHCMQWIASDVTSMITKNKHGKEVWMPQDKDYMSVVRIGYKSDNPLNAILELLSDYVMTWDNVRYLIEDVDWSSVKNQSKHPLKDVDEEYQLFMESLSDIKGHYETESVNYRCRFAYFATRITHIWIAPNSVMDRTLDERGHICAYANVNYPVSYVWLSIDITTGLPRIVKSNLNNAHIPLRLELTREGITGKQKISMDLKTSKTFNSIRGDFISLCVFKGSTLHSNDYQHLEFTSGTTARSFMFVMTFGSDHVYHSTWFNNAKTGSVEAYPVSLHPLHLDSDIF